MLRLPGLVKYVSLCGLLNFGLSGLALAQVNSGTNTLTEQPETGGAGGDAGPSAPLAVSSDLSFREEEL